MESLPQNTDLGRFLLESWPQNPEFTTTPKNFGPCVCY